MCNFLPAPYAIIASHLEYLCRLFSAMPACDGIAISVITYIDDVFGGCHDSSLRLLLLLLSWQNYPSLFPHVSSALLQCQQSRHVLLTRCTFSIRGPTTWHFFCGR